MYRINRISYLHIFVLILDIVCKTQICILLSNLTKVVYCSFNVVILLTSERFARISSIS